MTCRPLIVTAALCVTALVRSAAAHPYGPEYYSFRTVVDLDGSSLRITTAVEVPTMKVLEEYAALYGHLDEIGEEQDREFFQRMLTRIGEGLVVQLDGQPVDSSWKAADSPINGRADERFFYYILTFDAASALPSGGGHLQVLNRCFEDAEAYYSGWIRPAAGWRVEQSNLNALGDAARAEDVSTVKEAWSKDASLRNLEVRIAPAGEAK